LAMQRRIRARRAAIAGSVVAMLAFAAVALGGTERYHGKDADPQCTSVPFPNACVIKFRGKIRNQRVVKVTDFVFKDIPMACDEGSYVVTNDGPNPSPLPRMRVSAQRRFRGGFVDSTRTKFIHVEGRFSTSFRRASGQFRFHGDFTVTERPPSGAHNCDTGTDAWHARVG
jgi:hypothetical protein